MSRFNLEKRNSFKNSSQKNPSSQNFNHIKVRASRKFYFPQYIMALTILISILFVYFYGEKINVLAFIIGVIFSLSLVKYSFFSRMMNSYEIDNHYLVHTHGIINKTTKKILLPTISDIVVQQNPWQAIWGYGTIKVHRYSDGSAIDLKNIPNPKKIADILGNKLNNEEEI